MQITTAPAAKILELSEAGVRRLASLGILPCTRTQSGLRLFELADVERLAAERQAQRDAARERVAS